MLAKLVIRLNFAAVLASCAIQLGDAAATEQLELWKGYKSEFNKRYATPEEDKLRMAIFMKTKQMVDEYNARGKSTYTMSMDSLADWTDEERKGLLGVMKSGKTRRGISLVRGEKEDLEEVVAPPQLDWRDSGMVSPVKHQLDCGSCWAFAAIAAIESALLLNYYMNISLSEQNVLDCAESPAMNLTARCKEGLSFGNACDYIFEHGVVGSEEYPYEGKAGECRRDLINQPRVIANIGGYREVNAPFDNKQLMKSLTRYGPHYASVMYNRDEFAQRTTDVYEFKTYEIDKIGHHAMLLIGYGNHTDSKSHEVTPYWLFKNSWGIFKEPYPKIAMNWRDASLITIDAAYPISVSMPSV